MRLNFLVLPLLEVKYGCGDDCTVPILFCKGVCEELGVVACWPGVTVLWGLARLAWPGVKELFGLAS